MNQILDDATPGERQGIAPRILLLDDEGSILDMLVELLSLIGYSAMKCESPLDALDLLRDEPFDVVLSDYHMPQMNGDAFYSAALQEVPELKERIVFLTGDTLGDDIQAFVTETGSPYLSKPFQLEAVQQMIESIVARKGLRSVSLH